MRESRWSYIDIRHDRPFRFSVWHQDRYFGFRRTFWGASKLAADAFATVKAEGEWR